MVLYDCPGAEVKEKDMSVADDLFLMAEQVEKEEEEEVEANMVAIREEEKAECQEAEMTYLSPLPDATYPAVTLEKEVWPSNSSVQKKYSNLRSDNTWSLRWILVLPSAQTAGVCQARGRI